MDFTTKFLNFFILIFSSNYVDLNVENDGEDII